MLLLYPSLQRISKNHVHHENHGEQGSFYRADPRRLLSGSADYLGETAALVSAFRRSKRFRRHLFMK